MSKKIKITRVETNLKRHDRLINIHSKEEYRVIYLDLVEAKVVITTLNHFNSDNNKNDFIFVLDLKEDCSNFEILT